MTAGGHGFDGVERRGLMFVLSSPSGAGKTTLSRLLIERMPGLKMSVSATTRPMRPGEVDGRDYLFVEKSSFGQVQQMKIIRTANVAAVRRCNLVKRFQPVENQFIGVSGADRRTYGRRQPIGKFFNLAMQVAGAVGAMRHDLRAAPKHCRGLVKVSAADVRTHAHTACFGYQAAHHTKNFVLPLDTGM